MGHESEVSSSVTATTQDTKSPQPVEGDSASGSSSIVEQALAHLDYFRDRERAELVQISDLVRAGVPAGADSWIDHWDRMAQLHRVQYDGQKFTRRRRRLGDANTTAITGPVRAPVARTSVLTSPLSAMRTKSYSKGVPEPSIPACEQAFILRETCAHGNQRPKLVGCGSWRCEGCRAQRVAHELSPEIRAMAERALVSGRTLKMLTGTFPTSARMSLNSDEGRRARYKHRHAFVQAMRRNHGVFEYLQVPETHKSGRVHTHMLVDMRYVPQAELQNRWGGIIHIEALYVKCPACWTPGATNGENRRSRVVLRPDRTARCKNGHSMNYDQALQRFSIGAAWEVGKYLTKESDVGRLTRSRRWIKALPAPAEQCKCGAHDFEFVAKVRGDAETALALDMWTARLNNGSKPCACFGEGLDWSELPDGGGFR